MTHVLFSDAWDRPPSTGTPVIPPPPGVAVGQQYYGGQGVIKTLHLPRGDRSFAAGDGADGSRIQHSERGLQYVPRQRFRPPLQLGPWPTGVGWQQLSGAWAVRTAARIRSTLVSSLEVNHQRCPHSGWNEQHHYVR